MTAEQFYKSNEDYNMEIDKSSYLFNLMNDYAKYHVEKAIQEICDKATLESRLYKKYRGIVEKTENLGEEVNLEEQLYLGIDKQSIINAYPLELIK